MIFYDSHVFVAAVEMRLHLHMLSFLQIGDISWAQVNLCRQDFCMAFFGSSRLTDSSRAFILLENDTVFASHWVENWLWEFFVPSAEGLS